MFIIILLAVIVILLGVVHLAFNYNKKARIMRRIPGPKDSFIFGNALALATSPVELFKLGRTWANEFKGLYRFWSYPFSVINIYNPHDIEKILSTTKHNEKSEIYKFMRPWLREGLLLSGGLKWQNRRKVLTPAFHFNILRHFTTVLEENSHRMAERMAELSRDFTADVGQLMSEYTLHSICETAMGTRLDEESSEESRTYKNSIYKLGQILVERFIKLYLFWDSIFELTKIGRLQKIHLGIIHGFTTKVIKDRKEFIEKHGINTEETVNNDLHAEDIVGKKHKLVMLDLLISAEKEGKIDEIGIQEEVDTFMFEGHDTTASGLAFCLMALANHKPIQDKIYKEVTHVLGDIELANIEHLTRMKYLECCIKESLRLYPPVPFISRSLQENVVLSNHLVPAGTQCHIHIYDLHRREDLYKNPLLFDPDRFLPENSYGRHPYTYIPFSAGPRNCIGQKFAMLEMKSAIATILRQFELRPVTKMSDIEISADLVLRNVGPIYVNFIRRN